MLPLLKALTVAGCWIWAGHDCKKPLPTPSCAVFVTPDGEVLGISCKNGVEPAWIVVPGGATLPEENLGAVKIL